jgi:hypothetical protein
MVYNQEKMAFGVGEIDLSQDRGKSVLANYFWRLPRMIGDRKTGLSFR